MTNEAYYNICEAVLVDAVETWAQAMFTINHNGSTKSSKALYNKGEVESFVKGPIFYLYAPASLSRDSFMKACNKKWKEYEAIGSIRPKKKGRVRNGEIV